MRPPSLVAAPRPALITALVLALVLLPAGVPAPLPAAAQAVTPTPTSGPGKPPANDPAGPPAAYTLARSDQLFVAKTQQRPSVQAGVQALSAFASTYTVKSDLSGVSSSTPYADTGMSSSDPSWPLLPVRGRFTDPLHEQALLLSQSNNCSGTGSCTYALELGQPTIGERSVTTWFRLVTGASGGSPVAVAAGDLDGRFDAQGFPNDEAVVAYRWADGTLQVNVIDYNASPGG